MGGTTTTSGERDSDDVGTAGHHLDLLVRADVRWVRWGPLYNEPSDQKPWARYGRFLAGVVALGGDGSALLCQPDLDPVPPWITGPDIPPAIEELERGLQATDHRLATDPRYGSTAAREREINRHACQVHLSRLVATPPVESAPAVRVDLCVDLRFSWRLGGVWLQVTTSQWSSRPRSPRHAPQDTTVPVPRRADADDRGAREGDGAGGTGTAPLDARNREAPFRVARDEVHEEIKKHLYVRNVAVYRNRDTTASQSELYHAPVFWVALCRPPGPPGTPHDLDDCDVIRTLSEDILKARPSSCWLARHDLVAGPRTAPPIPLTVLRRQVLDRDRHDDRVDDPEEERGENARPRYIVVPDRDPVPDAGQPAIAQEEAVRALIHRVTDDETAFAAELFDLTTDLGLHAGLCDLYEVVAARAAALWDQLAMHLPRAHGTDVGDAHRWIGLLHAGLLQGIADLDHLAGLVEEDCRRAEMLDRTDLGVDRQFDAVAHRAGVAHATVGDAIRDTGYIPELLSWAMTVQGRAQHTRGSFGALHDAISHAFDARRVRDTDQVGKIALGAAFGLALVGFVTESFALALTVEPRTPFAERPWPWLVISSVVVVALAVAGWSRVRRLGTFRTSTTFDHRYERLRDYLGACRTERLDHLQATWGEAVDTALARDGADAAHAAERRYYAKWDGEDRQLAVQAAAVMDDVVPRRPRLESNDVADLGRAVEEWLLAAMLFSERPRAFWKYPAPRLQLLYRFYPVVDRALPAGVRRPDLVAGVDFALAMGSHLGLTRREVRRLETWGRTHVGAAGSAREALRTIELTGIRPGLGREEMTAILDHIAPVPAGTGSGAGATGAGAGR